jgi:peptidoglycan lytic transglycosylase F
MEPSHSSRQRFLLIAGMVIIGWASMDAAARSIADVLKSRELRVCIAFTTAASGKAEPPGCRTDCVMSGDTPDLAAAFAASLGPQVKPKWMNIGWEEQFQNNEGKVVREAAYTPELLANDTCDFYATGFLKNEWRSKKMDFVTLNLSRFIVLVNKSNKSNITSAGDLAGKRTATYKETAYEAWITTQNQTTYKDAPITWEFVADDDAIMKAVDTGSVDFGLMVSDVALPLLNEHPNVVGVFGVGSISEMAWAFRKEDQDLQAVAQRFIRLQRKDLNSLMNKQFQGAYRKNVLEYDEYVRSLK